MSISAVVQGSHTPPRIQVTTAGTSVYRVVGTTSTLVRGDITAGVIYDYEAPQDTVA